MNKDVKRPAPGGKPSAKIDTKTLKRLLTYMKPYRGTMIVVTICILLSAVAGAVSSMFLQTLIDSYIVPLLGMDEPVFTGLIRTVRCPRSFITA